MTIWTAGANCNLTNAGLTATQPSAALGTAKSDCNTDQVGPSKLYAEITINATLNGGVGFANAAESSFIAGSANSFGVLQDGTVMRDTYTYMTNFSSALAAADILRIAIDKVAALWWVQRNAEAWNPFLTSADPNTGVNGLAFSAGAGPWFLYFSNDLNAGSVTLNPGQGAFSGPIPTGYAPWRFIMPQGAM